ncbi:MAG: hypothetical protein KGZ25_08190, partial [Planctomycetes bacterium]|nr:hypothetical protein [Planctomycetota bacterium]
MRIARVKELIEELKQYARDAVRALGSRSGSRQELSNALNEMSRLQKHYCDGFPEIPDEVEFWERLWRFTDTIRDQWDRLEKVADKIPDRELVDGIYGILHEKRRRLYHWTRGTIEDRAPRVPSEAHFELGIDHRREDLRGMHERVEALYESIKRADRLPEICENAEPGSGDVNFGLIYGGGWNVSTYSIMREARNLPDLNVVVGFDHPGSDLFGIRNGCRVRLAGSGFIQRDGKHILTSFREPVVLHFICPHQWQSTEIRPHQLRVPLLRSDLVLDVVDNKLTTTHALETYRNSHGTELPLIREEAVPAPASLPADCEELETLAHCGLERLAEDGVDEAVVKPSFGMQEQGVEYFCLPAERAEAAAHAAVMALESGAVLQEKVTPLGGLDYNWRVFVALSPGGQPETVGQFARLGHGDEMEMVPDREMLRRVGLENEEQIEGFIGRLQQVSLNAYRAVVEDAERRGRDFEWKPLAGVPYTVPYFLGMDLMGDARVMEVNGHEVAGMWTDDRLYPESSGRSNRLV